MTATIERPTDEVPPPSPSRRTPAVIALAAVAIVAIVALTIVAVVSTRSNNHGSMMADMSRGSGSTMMMGNGSMMGGGSMMGPMAGQSTTSPTIQGAPQLSVSATSFAFTPKVLHVKAGQAVNIVLSADDVLHDFTIDELKVHIVAHPGMLGWGGFTAPSTPGDYVFYCSVAGHRQAGMTGTLIVDPT
jgi:heme/copper-type cytochrome/quinol oxidase subunit 2